MTPDTIICWWILAETLGTHVYTPSSPTSYRSVAELPINALHCNLQLSLGPDLRIHLADLEREETPVRDAQSAAEETLAPGGERANWLRV